MRRDRGAHFLGEKRRARDRPPEPAAHRRPDDPILDRHDCSAFFADFRLVSVLPLVCLPSWESSFYFSDNSYSRVCYGDVVLPGVSRLLGPIESVTGVLMCGISVSGLVALATKLVERESGVPAMGYVSGLDRHSEAELEKVS